MAEFNLIVNRIESVTKRVVVEANSLVEAIDQTNELLTREGWSAICNADDMGEPCTLAAWIHGTLPDASVLTVGELRALIADAPADIPIFPDWVDGPPGDNDPAVTLHGMQLTDEGLKVLVDIEYLNSDEDEDDEDDDEEGDDMCDLCMRSGVAVYRTTLDGDTVCGSKACQDAADAQDEAYRLANPAESDEESE